MIAVHSTFKRKRNRAVRERALILAASRLFASRGFEATKTREIAALAGCAEGLIHRYFNSKSGLLLALIRHRVSREMIDLQKTLPVAATLEAEIVQLVDWEVRRMWDEREFLKVTVPRALLDGHLGRLIARTSLARRSDAIRERLNRFKEHLPKQELEAIAEFVSATGFVFGFARPVILRQNPGDARRTANLIAGMLARRFRQNSSGSNGRN
jgi:AcrR family transcriptional regulator